MRAIAVIAIRNERDYLANCLRHLIEQGVDFAVIDNESEDGSVSILKEPRFARHLAAFETLPYTGAFDLSAQLEAKERMYRRLDAEWLMHVDADEEMISYHRGERLIDGFKRVAKTEEADAVNFDEFVFLPVDNAYVPDFEGSQPMNYYYFFEPSPQRLVRAWKADLPLSSVSSGGHRLSGADFKLSSENFAMRHYIFRNQEHAMRKYTKRYFNSKDLKKGWHRNRKGFTEEDFIFPDISKLQCIETYSYSELSCQEPMRHHYWEWRDKENFQMVKPWIFKEYIKTIFRIFKKMNTFGL